MSWRKLGRIYDYSGNGIEHHMQCPTVLVMDTRLRIFYADRDEQNRSFIAYIDVERDNPCQTIAWHAGPIIERGKPGTFDEDGMMPSCIVKDGDVALYYSGWNRGGAVPYRNSIGVLFSEDGEKFTRVYDGPLLDRAPSDPYMVVTPFVIDDFMYYVSGTKWVSINDKLEPVYVIKVAEWTGSHWGRSRHACIKPDYELEAFSNPSVIRNGNGGYSMFFCSRDSRDYRGGDGSYRIRSAHSKDGFTWVRTIEGLDVTAGGWDSEMTAYPQVIDLDGKRLMFYNGNGFGRSGIGIAEWI